MVDEGEKRIDAYLTVTRVTWAGCLSIIYSSRLNASAARLSALVMATCCTPDKHLSFFSPAAGTLMTERRWIMTYVVSIMHTYNQTINERRMNFEMVVPF